MSNVSRSRGVAKSRQAPTLLFALTGHVAALDPSWSSRPSQAARTVLPGKVYMPYGQIGHRRRIELEDKAKVVPSDWGTESLPRLLFCLSLFETNG